MTGALIDDRTLGTEQLILDFAPAPTAESFLLRLKALGMQGIDRCVLTRNRSVMISFRDGVLRLHRAYLVAPAEIHHAIVTFVMARTRRARRGAQEVILRYPIPPDDIRPPRTRVRVTHPADLPHIEKLRALHRHYNDLLFEGRLSPIAIYVSGRMRSRLGHYAAACANGSPAEITISRRHIRRHGWDDVVHTLLHEMVHQWQAETGLPLDHGPAFRAKARAIGIG